MTLEERTLAMVNLYGEVCTKANAARILGRTPQTVRNMIDDGRIDLACGGEMVCVRSIARYIHQPKQADNSARACRFQRKYHSEFSV